MFKKLNISCEIKIYAFLKRKIGVRKYKKQQRHLWEEAVEFSLNENYLLDF